MRADRQRLRARLASHHLPVILCALGLVGCVGYRPLNQPLEQWDPSYGYRVTDPAQHPATGSTYIYLAFSGGGTRAAAFAYGVLEALRDTEVTADGHTFSLLDEVDAISGVSGGSFPAAYYGLYGNRIFDDFEERFLKRNVQRGLLLQALRPKNLLRLFTPFLSRSELAAQYYDKHVFEDATFADLLEAHGPRIHINATDLTGGSRFTFTQNYFDMICSDIGRFPISVAVASSSAVPVLLSPITLQNYAGQCGLEVPDWLSEALKTRRSDPRRYRTAHSIAQYLDPEAKKYVHLVDGGIADNLGLRAGLEMVETAGGILETPFVEQTQHIGRVVVIVVNAETAPDPNIDLVAAAPGFASLMGTVSGAQISRYNFESMMLMKESLHVWRAHLREAGREVSTHFVNVSFEDFESEADQRYFENLPTSFYLSQDVIQELRQAGRSLLESSTAFQALVASFD